VYQSQPSAQELFRAAGEDARREGGELLGAHVLRAASAMDDGPAARVLRGLGVDAALLQAAATAEIEAYRPA
jgi:hypothetical protein